jgi:hypothetical protein
MWVQKICFLWESKITNVGSKRQQGQETSEGEHGECKYSTGRLVSLLSFWNKAHAFLKVPRKEWTCLMTLSEGAKKGVDMLGDPPRSLGGLK